MVRYVCSRVFRAGGTWTGRASQTAELFAAGRDGVGLARTIATERCVRIKMAVIVLLLHCHSRSLQTSRYIYVTHQIFVLLRMTVIRSLRALQTFIHV